MIKVLIMAGGRAERLSGIEKPLLKVCGKFIIEHVVRIAKSFSNEVYVSITQYSKNVREWAKNRGDLYVIEAPGHGYVRDLMYSIEEIGRFPILTLPADTPFLTEEVIKDFINHALNSNGIVVTLEVRKGCNGLRHGPIGIALFKSFGGNWDVIPMCRYPDLLDIDTWNDLREAEKLCGEFMEV